MKRKLRLFCDYCAETPLWEDDYESVYCEYNKSVKTLKSFGVTDYCITLMNAMQAIYEFAPADEPFTPEEEDSFQALMKNVVVRLNYEIGDKFEIKVD